MIECVKCGKVNTDDALACGDCTWPFSLGAWKTTRFKVKRVSIDTSRVNLKQEDCDMNTLEKWSKNRLILLQRSDALLEELRGSGRIAKAASVDPHPPVWVLGESLIGIDTYVTGPEMAEPIRSIIFPTIQVLT